MWHWCLPASARLCNLMHALCSSEDLLASWVMLGSSASYLVLLSCLDLHLLCCASFIVAPMSQIGTGCPATRWFPTKKFLVEVGNLWITGVESLAMPASVSASSLPLYSDSCSPNLSLRSFICFSMTAFLRELAFLSLLSK